MANSLQCSSCQNEMLKKYFICVSWGECIVLMSAQKYLEKQWKL